VALQLAYGTMLLFWSYSEKMRDVWRRAGFPPHPDPLAAVALEGQAGRLSPQNRVEREGYCEVVK
jgi:hypothetical protein